MFNPGGFGLHNSRKGKERAVEPVPSTVKKEDSEASYEVRRISLTIILWLAY